MIILIIIALALAWIGALSLRRANREGDGGFGSALIGCILLFLAVVFGLVALLALLWPLL